MEVRHTFGDCLRSLRKRSQLTAAELADAVGYSTAHILMLELNQRVPDAEIIVALFVPALQLQTEHELTAQLVRCAADLRAEHSILVRAEAAEAGEMTEGWWDNCSDDARAIAATLSIMGAPVDLRSAIVMESILQALDARAGARQLLELKVIASLSEALLSSAASDYIDQKLSDAERTAGHVASARISELMFNDYVQAAMQLALTGNFTASAEVFFDRIDLLVARGEADAAVVVMDEALTAARSQAADAIGLFKVLAVRGELLLYGNQDVEAERSLREALSLARPAERRARTAAVLAQLMLRRGQAAEALELTSVALESLTALDTLLLSKTSAIQAQALAQLSQLEGAAEKAERALWLADALGHVSHDLGDDARAIADNVLGQVHKQRAHPQLALFHFDRAAHAATRLRTRHQLCLAKVSSAYLYLDLGMPDMAESNAAAALSHARELGDGKLAARMSQLLGLIHYYSGRSEMAERSTAESIELRRRLVDHGGLIASYAQMVRVLVDAGEVQRAYDLALRLADETRHMTEPVWRAGALDTLAWANMARGELAAAHTSFDELHRMIIVMKHPTLGAIVRNHDALFSLLRGLPIDALQSVSTPHPPAAGHEVEWERRLIEALATVAMGNQFGGVKMLSRIEHVAVVDGFGRFSRVAREARDALAVSGPIEIGRLYFGVSTAKSPAAHVIKPQGQRVTTM